MQALSGNGNLAVDNTTKKIYNGSSSFGSSIADNASGSVLINGYNISSLTFSVYMRGKGSFLSSWGSTLGSVNYGDAYSIGVSLEVPFSISGNLFDDANGMTDGIVNGTGANAGGMNAILVDHNTGMVADYNAIPASGAYSFDNVTYGDYDVMISTASPTINATAPTVALPSGWVNTGEYTQTTAGSDGTPDGKIALGTVSAATTNINFGIDELPVSVAQVFTIPSPVVDASAILNGSGTVPQPLQGSDQDDHTTRATTPSTVAITELPSNGQLWYNGVMITKGKDGINAPSPTNPFIITSYNPNRLSIKFTGSGYVTSSFKYSIVDNAGMLSTPSLYTVNWTKPLAIQMTQFSATEQNCTAKINFATGVETDVKEINIQYSTDGSEFATVQTIAPKGSNSNYSFQYSLPANSSDYHFYQLEIVDIDGKKE